MWAELDGRSPVKATTASLGWQVLGMGWVGVSVEQGVRTKGGVSLGTFLPTIGCWSVWVACSKNFVGRNGKRLRYSFRWPRKSTTQPFSIRQRRDIHCLLCILTDCHKNSQRLGRCAQRDATLKRGDFCWNLAEVGGGGRRRLKELRPVQSSWGSVSKLQPLTE